MAILHMNRPLSSEEQTSRLPIDDFYVASGGGALELTYIHQSALAAVALDSNLDTAQQICDGLSSMRMRRLVGHHLMASVLSDPASDHYKLAHAAAERELDIIDGGKHDLRWLSRMYGVAEAEGQTNYYRLLHPNNRLENTCYDDGFYTLAQTSRASDWMYEDSEDFSTFLTKVAQGNGPEFLTVVCGGKYAIGEFAGSDYASIPDRIVLADTVYLGSSAAVDGKAYATLPFTSKEQLSVDELDTIEFDSRVFRLGIMLNTMRQRINELRREASVAEWIGRGAYAQTKTDRADLLADSRRPLQKIFEMRHFNARPMV